MPAFLLEEVAYSPSHILSAPLYIPQNILENMRIFPSIISLIHPRGAKNERLKAKKWRTGAILLKLFAITHLLAAVHGANTAIMDPRPERNRRNGGIMPGICRMKPSLTLEYHHIPGLSAGTVPQDPLYSAADDGLLEQPHHKRWVSTLYTNTKVTSSFDISAAWRPPELILGSMGTGQTIRRT